MLSRAKKRHSPPVPICLQNLRHSPAHLETSSSCRSGRPRGPEISRDTLSININWFQAILDRFKHILKIVHFRSFWSHWWLGASYDLAFRSRAYLSLILTHWNSNQCNSMLSRAKNASPHQSQFVSKISETLQLIWRHPLAVVPDVQEA